MKAISSGYIRLCHRIGIKHPVWFLLLFITAAFFFTKELFGINDFTLFYIAAKDYVAGGNIYTNLYGDGFRVFNSPLFFLFIAPFSDLDMHVIGWIWKALLFIMLYRTWHIGIQLADPQGQVRSKYNLIAFLVFISSVGLIFENIHMHQLTIFMLWGSLECFYQVSKGKHLKAGLILALVINIKLMPLVLIPFLIYRGEWKTLGYTFLFLIVFFELPGLYTGFERNHELLGSWFNLINPLNAEHNIDVSETCLCSITSIVPTYLMDSAQWNPNFDYNINFSNVSESTVTMVVNIMRGLIVLLTLMFLRFKPFKREQNSDHDFLSFCYIMLATFLIFPHQQLYGMYLVLPALIMIVVSFYRKDIQFRSKKAEVILFVVCAGLMSSFYILGDFKKFLCYTKLPAFGVLLLIPILHAIHNGLRKKHKA